MNSAFRRLRPLLALLPALLLAGCSEPTAEQLRDREPTPLDPDDDAELVFSEDSLLNFEFTVTDSAWQWLQRHAVEEQYVPAQLRVMGKDWGTVGLRYKGAWGNLRLCFDEQGNQLHSECPKISMKVDFAQYAPEQRFHGLKKINLHSMIRDVTKLQDRLTYRLFREMGVHTARATHATLTVNGRRFGLFALVENIDGRFTDSRWSPGDGDLFKEVWPQSTNAADYLPKLKTNELTATGQRLADFAAALPQIAATGDRARFASFTDPEQALDYLAVDIASQNIDGYRTFYCWEGSTPSAPVCAPHNLYWYEDEVSGLLTLIPWDHDGTFNEVPFLRNLPEWNDLSIPCVPFHTNNGNDLMPASCDPYFRTLALHYDAEYRLAIQRLLDGPMQLATIDGWLDRWAAQIAPAVAQDSLLDLASWQQAVAKLKGMVRLMRYQMEQRLAGRAPTAPGLRTDAVNDFEGLEPTFGAMIAASNSNSASLLTAAIEQLEPLSGTRHLRLDWQFRNQLPDGNDSANTWSQWGSWRLPWSGSGLQDLRSLALIRVKISSSRNRSFNLDLSSTRYRNPNLGRFWGWEFNLSTGENEVTLALDPSTMRYGWPGLSATTDNQPPLDSLLEACDGILLYPTQKGRVNGVYPAGAADTGWAKIDDLEFVLQ